MGDVAIPRMQISSVIRTVDHIESIASRLASDVDTLSERQQAVITDLRQLASAFIEFVEADKHAKELQLAETRIVKVRQELENTFGYYNEVRRSTTGLLQSTDHGMVSDDTARFVFEEALLKAPGYWLAWAMNALSSWAADSRDKANRALLKALEIDSYKCSLLMTLTCRRLDRPAATAQWLRHFMRHQDPSALDREFIVLMDAVSHQLLGTRARIEAANTMDEWLEQLGHQSGFTQAQVRRWADVIRAGALACPASRFKALREHSPTWGALEASLNLASCHQPFEAFIRSVMNAPDSDGADVIRQCDDLMERLVTDFDPVELPLRQREQRLQLIIESGGDTKAADRKMKAQDEAFQEHVEFTALLTNAAMYPKQSQASPATRKFAIAKCRDWITSAHDDLTSKARSGAPGEIAIDISGWKARTVNGENETELRLGLSGFYEALKARALEKLTPPLAGYLGLIVGGLLVMGGLADSSPNVVMIVMGIGACLFGAIQFSAQSKKRESIELDFDDRLDTSQKRLKQVLAEVVEYRKAWRQADGLAANTSAYLRSISVAEYQLSASPKDHAA